MKQYTKEEHIKKHTQKENTYNENCFFCNPEGFFIIERLKEGWYNFDKLPQERRYIKINCLNCGTDRKALNTAYKILDGKKNVFIKNGC